MKFVENYEQRTNIYFTQESRT